MEKAGGGEEVRDFFAYARAHGTTICLCVGEYKYNPHRDNYVSVMMANAQTWIKCYVCAYGGESPCVL